MREVTQIPEEWLQEISETDRARIEEFLNTERDREREDFDFNEYDMYSDNR